MKKRNKKISWSKSSANIFGKFNDIRVNVTRLRNLEKANKRLRWLRHGKNVESKLAQKLDKSADKVTTVKTTIALNEYNKILKQYLWVREITAHSKQQKEYWKEKRSYQLIKNKVLFKNKQFRAFHVDLDRGGTSKIDYIHNNLLERVYQIIEESQGQISQADAEEQAWQEAVASGKVKDLQQNISTGVEWGYIDEDAKEIISPID